MRRFRRLALLGWGAVLGWLPAAGGASPWVARVDDATGLPLLERGGARILSANLAFWERDWKWADSGARFLIDGPGSYRIEGDNRALGLRLRAQVARSGAKGLHWTIALDSASDKTGVIGGGVVFHLNLAQAQGELGEPELLPGNRGWAWGSAGAHRVEFRVDPPAAAVYFERGHKDEIRVFFFKDSIPAGRHEFAADLETFGDVELRQTHLERFGKPDPGRWKREAMDAGRSPVDLSFLNAADRPAGSHGYVAVAQGRLAFEDGTPARFWGTNLAASALFSTPKDEARRQARRLAALGFNLVRLHHHDSPWVSPNATGADPSKPSSTLDEASMDRLDWWIHCLKQEGIYVWLDLHVQRALRKSDGIAGFDEILSKGADLKGFNYVNDSIRSNMLAFDAAYLQHRNRYTGLRYVDEPAIAALLITNENDVTHHFGNALLPDKGVPWHTAAYLRQARDFASAHGLSEEKTWRSWENGPSKIFLNDLEHRFGAEMIARLRELGVKVPIATTSYWGAEPLSSLPALSTGDLIDAHSYGTVDELSRDPRYAANIIDWIAAAHVAGKPLTVSEWNVEPFPTPDRHTLPLYIASQGDLQGWDALMQFAYAQQAPAADTGARNWNSFNDPALMATLPAAALLFRQHHVAESQSTYVLAPQDLRFFDEPPTPESCAALRTATERGKFLVALPATKQLPWLRPGPATGGRVLADGNETLLARDARSATSDTGELHRDWEEGVFTIDTALTQAAMGWIGGRAIELRDAVIQVETPNATVAVQSLDGAPIRASRRLLVSLGTRALPVGPEGSAYASEPLRGRIAIRSEHALRLYALGAIGTKREMAVGHDGDRHVIELGASAEPSWLLLEAP